MAFFIDNPSFPAGLKVIAIDHDITVLNTIEDMCNRFHYQVTKCNTASDALNLLERKDCFDVMLIDPHMPNMDAYDFVQHVTLQLNIPVIMMAVDFTTSSIMKSIQCGASTYLTKPLVEEEVKIMWQHVVRKGVTENKECEIVESLVVQECRKRGREDDKVSKETNAKKARLSWSPELHQRFLWAVNQLGLDKSRPKMILKIMDVPGLSVGHVASHLQKYRIHLKRSADETKPGKKKTKWSDSSQAEWIDQNRNDDFLAKWIDCGAGSYLHNLMA
ncbi:putative response regulator and transcription factor RR-A-type family [Medicago truncatula]|uniref:Putative response regulator and transcription factor RR-A-type family n=1 Tax=Medicago truncatula TaxID=3880 RepID=A0A072UH21_MEDTR|nr:two-component response regulator [Medicago truncatula]RHN59127.1 putative response regulator and transcription factor RR-A-type family [Medicago truncatula]